jgi:hypothetical protein
MGAREAGTATGRIGARSAALAVAGALALGLAACGEKEEDFANEPRAPAPIHVSASVDSERVSVSPNRVGAGLATLTVANLSDQPVTLTLVGPGPNENPSTDEIPADGVGSLRADLREGDYELTAGGGADLRPDRLTVGPERPSSSDQLLLP